MCWKCHGAYKHKLQRDSASSSGGEAAAHIPSKEVRETM